LEAPNLSIFGLYQVFLDLIGGELSITIGWKIWSDFFIIALNKNSNQLVKEIANFLETILNKLEELEDKFIAKHKEKEN